MTTQRRRSHGIAPLPCALLLSISISLTLGAHAKVAQAHGDTIRVAYSSIQPERLVVKLGTTVHFHNANASGAPCTIVFEDGATKSPPLGRAEGWHHTFDAAGEFGFRLSEFPSRTGVVVVVAP